MSWLIAPRTCHSVSVRKPAGRFLLGLVLAGFLVAGFQTVPGATETNAVAAGNNDVLLLDSLGQVVRVPTNTVTSGLENSAGYGQENQIPQPTAGSSMPPELMERLGRGAKEFQFFSAYPPLLMPYLASQNEYGNTAFRPGPLFNFVPMEGTAQTAKYWLSEYGFRYSLQQTFTYVSMSDIKQGDSELAFYTFDLKSKWNIYNAPDNGTAGWISTQVEAKNGLGPAGDTQSAKSNLGTVTDPTGIWSSVNGFRVPELAWQQSLRHGEIVVVAGMVSQRNYFDGNAYADSGRSKFLNSALIDSQVLPLAGNNFGMNLQWQPLDEWYAMIGASMGNAHSGETPWNDFHPNNWSLIGEVGYAPRDFLGLGPGIYRVQPFLAQVTGTLDSSYTVTIPGTTNTTDVDVYSTTNSPLQAGLCFDLQQKLGTETPYGWFGRFGFGGHRVTRGASVQAGTGFVMQGPFKHFLVHHTSNDLLGIGFIWSEPSSTSETVYHQNEYVLETVYALQLMPTVKVQTDFQMIWDPAFSEYTSRAMVFQLQLAIAF
jgi:porin